MKLPFRYQFLFAPLVIVILLACLVAYTLVELSKINDENEINRQWEILTDRIQVTIASTNRLNIIIDKLSSPQDVQQDEQLFSYLEQAGILYDNLYDSTMMSQLLPELHQVASSSEPLLREPERSSPTDIRHSLNTLLPLLEYQYKIFAAQRRTAFIRNHHQLNNISSRMTTVLLTGLILCIALASGLTLWGLRLTRQRLKYLSQSAHDVCADEEQPALISTIAIDELDDLELCLANMATRLETVVSMENVLRGAENERRRIAMDMHDGVLADLTAINRMLDSQTVNPARLETLRGEIDNVINNLRRTIDDLHPQILETLGLESALHSLLDRHSTVTGFPKYHFDFAEDIDNAMSAEQKLNLFRIISEAINNVISHAHCDQFEVCLRRVQNNLIATVEDNGTGMPDIIKHAGHGCANISERAHLIGATVQWRAARFSCGTCFELILPLAIKRSK